MTPLTADQMREALYRHFAGRYAVLFEVSTDVQPEAAGTLPLWRRRQVDVLTVARSRKPGTGPLDLLAIEIKVSRSDFLADIREPAKQARWREVANRHAYAVPEGLVQPAEIPAGSGLLTVAPPGVPGGYHYDVNWRVRAASGGSRPDVPSWLTLAFAYRMSRAEAKLRGFAAETRNAGESPEDLRGALAKAHADLEGMRKRHDRAVNEAAEWRLAFAAAGGSLPCMHCGQPIKPRTLRGGHFSTWRHRSTAHDAACAAIRDASGSRWAQVEPADPDSETEAS